MTEELDELAVVKACVAYEGDEGTPYVNYDETMKAECRRDMRLAITAYLESAGLVQLLREVRDMLDHAPHRSALRMGIPPCPTCSLEARIDAVLAHG